MSESKYTPGPWRVCDDSDGYPSLVCDMTERRGVPGRVATAILSDDARLIAAAPDLYEALEACAEALAVARDRLGMCGEGDGPDRKADTEDYFGSLRAIQGARAAIAKAEGRSR